MGLGAPKKRSKLATDPNNTAWTKNTTNFGHRMLTSQGWSPGEYLGARDANHADHYTAANASHIRVMLREDNLGVGAQVGGNGRAETFGLATLSGIFGRLNGKSEGEVQKQQDNIRDVELKTWQDRKYGSMRFVYGGLLVGDKMEEEVAKVMAASKKRKAEEEGGEEEKESKKLKAEASSSDSSESEIEEKKEKKDKKKKDRKSKSSDEDDSEDAEAKRLRKKAKRKAKREAAGDSTSDAATDEKALRKQEKRAHKEEKRRRKEEKKAAKASKSASAAVSESATPTTASGTSTPRSFAGSRHAVRARYIQQKRMASMDPKALQEILMLKASG